MVTIYSLLIILKTMSKEIQERIKAWEEKHGKRIEDLNAEETVEACMEVMCLTRSEAEEYLSATATSGLL